MNEAFTGQLAWPCRSRGNITYPTRELSSHISVV